jgi:ABC-type sugar transport system permease subunit
MIGYGSAIAVCVFVLSLLLSLLYVRLIGTRILAKAGEA